MTRMDLEVLQQTAARVRANCIRLGHAAGSQGAHFGPALSLVEVLTTLYGAVLDVAPDRTRDPDRDRLILSKGHGSLALYAVLHEFGFIPPEVLDTCETNGSPLPGQPIRNLDFGIEFSSGTLGLGLGFGAGLALSARWQGSDRGVYVVMGDGETNEGSVWESAMFASHAGLSNLRAIVDVNDMQSDGTTNEVLRMDHVGLWRGAGWDVMEADGHDVRDLTDALLARPSSAPRVVLAHTVKGKGVSFMENSADWHHGRLTEAQAATALSETEVLA